jgi:hypothetical protein
MPLKQINYYSIGDTKMATARKRTAPAKKEAQPEFKIDDVVTITVTGLVTDVYPAYAVSGDSNVFTYSLYCEKTDTEYYWNSDAPNVTAVLVEAAPVYEEGIAFQREEDGWVGIGDYRDEVPVRPFRVMVVKD